MWISIVDHCKQPLLCYHFPYCSADLWQTIPQPDTSQYCETKDMV